jgi:uncharacterized protein YhfF
MSQVGMRVCELGSPGALRDQLVDAVLRGEKTATTSLLSEWEDEKERLPIAGERQRLVDSDGWPVAVIELVHIEVIRLGDVDLRLALTEGEGFASVKQWREAHEAFWRVADTRISDHAPASLADDTRIVVEHFRLAGQPLA